MQQQIDFFLSGGELNLYVPIYFLAFQNLWWSVFNLLPIRPLDGGNVTAELFGIDLARRLSIVFAIAGAIWLFTRHQSYGAFFALFLAFNNYQEIRAARTGADVDVFGVESPDPAQGGHPVGEASPGSIPPLGGTAAVGAVDGEPGSRRGSPTSRGRPSGRATRPRPQRLTTSLGAARRPVPPRRDRPRRPATPRPSSSSRPPTCASPTVRRTWSPPRCWPVPAPPPPWRGDWWSGPTARGARGPGPLQTHLHYADRFAEAAEVGEVVYAANPPSQAQTAFEVACSWAKAGNVDRAATWLEQAADAGFRAASVVDGEPDLATVRADPRWPLLRARLV